LEAAPGPKYKAAMSAAYSAGLRVSEVVALKVANVDSNRMLLRIEQAKGRKDRLAMLSPRLLDFLRDWYCIARPAVWLFPGRDPMLPMTTRQLKPSMWPPALPRSTSGSRRTRYGTALPPICWNRMSTFA
jgi:integrase